MIGFFYHLVMYPIMKNEDKLLFDQVFRREIEKQLEQAIINFSEVGLDLFIYLCNLCVCVCD